MTKVAKYLSACTSVLVGKAATVDGSTLIARNDDTNISLMQILSKLQKCHSKFSQGMICRDSLHYSVGMQGISLD